MDDVGHLALLEGQRFVVLRPDGAVSAAYDAVRAALQPHLSRLPLSSPARPHVTLRGFPAGTPLAQVQALVQSWAPGISPLRIEVEGVGTFPPPFKTVVVRIRRTPPLVHALASLRDLARERALPDLPGGAPSVDEWIFHMTVAYCAPLAEDEWAELTRRVATLSVLPATCVVRQAEVAALDDLRESSGGFYPLTGDDGRRR